MTAMAVSVFIICAFYTGAVALLVVYMLAVIVLTNILWRRTHVQHRAEFLKWHWNKCRHGRSA